MNTVLVDGRERESIDKAIETLRAGQLVVFPTDTVYGVGADGFDSAAVDQLFAAKLRPGNRPIALLIAPEMDLYDLAFDVPSSALALAERYWPGGLTIILRRRPIVPNSVTVGGPTVGVRVPKHPIALDIIRGVGRPLATTSANLSGQPSPLTAEDALSRLDGRVPLVVDGGRCPGGVESTVIDLTTDVPTIRRVGAVPPGEIESVIGRMKTTG